MLDVYVDKRSAKVNVQTPWNFGLRIGAAAGERAEGVTTATHLKTTLESPEPQPQTAQHARISHSAFLLITRRKIEYPPQRLCRASRLT